MLTNAYLELLQQSITTSPTEPHTYRIRFSSPCNRAVTQGISPFESQLESCWNTVVVFPLISMDCDGVSESLPLSLAPHWSEQKHCRYRLAKYTKALHPTKIKGPFVYAQTTEDNRREEPKEDTLVQAVPGTEISEEGIISGQ
jgi:hypothetical protein